MAHDRAATCPDRRSISVSAVEMSDRHSMDYGAPAFRHHRNPMSSCDVSTGIRAFHLNRREREAERHTAQTPVAFFGDLK